MKKVLFFIGYPHRMAGSQKQIEHLILNLPSDFDPKVIVTKEGGVSKNFLEKGVATKVIATPETLNTFGKKILSWSFFKKIKVILVDYPVLSWRLYRFIHKEHFDIIHCNDVRAVLQIALASLFVRSKLVSHIQGERAIGHGVLWTIFEKLPKIIIANADFVRSTLHPDIHSKTKVIYTGIPEKVVSDKVFSRWIYQQKKERVIVGIFASVVPFKGYHHLIEAVTYLKNNDRIEKDFLILCIGEIVDEYQEYYEWLCKRISNDELDDYFLFTGWQNNPYGILDLCDMTVLPSIKSESMLMNDKVFEVEGNEGFPTTHLEALQYKKPVIGTNIAGVPEQVVNGYNGFLIEPGNYVELANSLKELILRDDLRKEFGENGYNLYLNRFTVDKYVLKVVEAYDEII